MSNAGFLQVVSNSFAAFMDKGTSRSTDKLKPLHGAVAHDLSQRLGPDFSVYAQGFGNDKEAVIGGRYLDKRVDITVFRRRRALAGIGVKFVMQNYAQNSNNYFENMLGETANIRCNGYPYFQIFVVLDKLPYYNKDKAIVRYDRFTDHNVAKYVALSQDDPNRFLHTPNKTLICVVEMPDIPYDGFRTQHDYLDFFRRYDGQPVYSSHDYGKFGPTVIVNDYELFREKVFHAIMAQ